MMAALDAAGGPIPVAHAQIVAIVLEAGGRLATRDRHFRNVSGLEIVEP